jgi:hypothetical protein
MPKIHLIRRDGGIIELNATNIAFNIQRGVKIWAIPIVGVRAGFDTNDNNLSITVDGIMTDDSEVSGSVGAIGSLDLSRPTTNADSWFNQQIAQDDIGSIADIVTMLEGKQWTFKSAGQVAAGLDEDITLRFSTSAGPAWATGAATNTIVPIDLSGVVNHTGHLADAIHTALTTNSVNVNGAAATISSIFTITQSAGQKQLSGDHQGVGALTTEKITITNITKGADGNTPITKSGALGVSTTQNWANAFWVSSSLNNGVTGSKMSRGDKIQDLLNMTMNASPGGGMLSAQSFTGDLIEMPDSISNFDISKFLRIDRSDNVEKYIVGIRIPYDSIITATGADTTVIRQFISPSGPGTSYPADENTTVFDPIDIVGGEVVRPNPFFRQGIAIPGVIQTFQPSYEAGDSVWTYTLGFVACEQLLGI